MNQALLRAISSGQTKEAAEAGTNFIREIVRQDSAVRDVIPPVGLTDAELDPDDRQDSPRKIVELEPRSVASRLEFRGQPQVTWFTANRYSVYFTKIASQKSVKPKEELMTYRNDIRSILAENKVKDMADVEDVMWNTLQMSAVQAAPALQTTMQPQFTAAAFAAAFRALIDRRRPLGRILLPKSLMMSLIELPASAVSNNVAEQFYRDGIEKENTLWGLPVTSTIKSNIYDPSSAWIYSPHNFLGNFFTLQDATLFMKQEANILEFYTYEILGMGIANRLSVQRLQFAERS